MLHAGRRAAPAPADTRVQVVPDWRDDLRKRWLVAVEGPEESSVRTYPDESEARLAAFLLTGVADFLNGITWVEGSRFPLRPF